MGADALVPLPKEKWMDLINLLRSDWPRCMSGCTFLSTQLKWQEIGVKFDTTVYCPYGCMENGFVAMHRKKSLYELVVICPKQDTSELEEALKQTTIVDWTHILVPFASENVINCLQRVARSKGLQTNLYEGESFYLDLDQKEQFCREIVLPPNLTIEHLPVEYVDLIDSKWRYNFKHSNWYFKLLLQAKCGFGLFKNNQLVSWVFYNEAGNLGHMYTIEDQRRKGYAELLLSVIAKSLLNEDKQVIAYCVKGNENAAKMYRKFGFKSFPDVAWVELKSTKKC